jgi:LmbE family N-acetylglucosaminyl deacetylase
MHPARVVMALGTHKPLLVLSPHCDDAVFACGELLESHPGSIVATIFAGRPSAADPLTEWDRAAGFAPADDVMEIRREEDRAALGLLGAAPLWLDFRDSQYGPTHSSADLRDAIEGVIRCIRPGTVVVPLGLFHSDHRSVHEAALGVAVTHRDCAWVLYEDALYRRIPGLVDERLRLVAKAGFSLDPMSFPVRSPCERKVEAVHCYRSQLRALSTSGRPGHQDALTAERYWACSWRRERDGHAE